MSEEYVNIADLSELGERTAPGEYTVKLTNVIPKRSKDNGHPMLELHWEVEGGEADGNTIRQWLTLTTYVTKKGKTTSTAINDIVKMRQYAGVPLPADFKFPLDEHKAGRELQPLFNKRMKAKVTEAPDRNDPTVIRTRIKIIGAHGASTVAPEGSDPLQDFA